ncbi:MULTISPECIES: DUF4262 domain-containing protein [Nonomuraea]|uniref:DUF4262 domain-containing protein n=1 Tax=Nonomuraea mangrovi TaxID=2316207 RepID=A0ABW4T773_9ACTN
MSLAESNLLHDVAAGIQLHGWIVHAVEGEGITPYAYTVGLISQGRPELLVAAAVYDREHVVVAELVWTREK